MSLMIQAMLFEKYGPRLNVDQLADTIGIATKTLYNKISRGSLPIPTYIDEGKRYADVRDVAEYFERKRAEAICAGLPA